MTVEPPATDGLFNESVDVQQGDWDREFWIEHAHTMHGIDTDVLETKPTGWIVSRTQEEPNRYYSNE